MHNKAGIQGFLKTRRRLSLAPVVGAFIFGGTVAAPVQSRQAVALEEVVVVARKREESLQETPVAVTAIGEEALRLSNIRDLGDLTRFVPGLDTRIGDKYAAFSIRGVGSRVGKNVTTDPAVGVYVDGIFLPRADSQLVDVIAMESIQVLRGPQGTLFGKNTAGGAMLLSTLKPHEELSGEVAVDLGNLKRRNLSGNLNVPIGDRLALRLTVDARRRDGYMDDVVTDIDFGDVNKTAYAAQLRWLASDNLTADFLLFYSEQDENAAPQTCQVADNPGTPLQRFTAPGDTRLLVEACDQSWALAGDDKVELDERGLIWKMNSTMAGMTWEWDTDFGTFKSITGYLQQDDISNWRDQDATSLFSITNTELVVEQMRANGIESGEEREFWSQEFQFTGVAMDDRLDYTAGFFYSSEKIENNPFGNILSPAGFLGTPLGADVATAAVIVLPPDLAGFRVSSLSDLDNTTYAAFLQGSWHFNEALSLTVGGRYGVEEKRATQRNFITAEDSPGTVSRAEFDALQGTIHELVPLSSAPYLQGEEEWSQFTPAVTLSYTAAEDRLESWGLDSLLLYGTWSKGFKAGGFVVIEDALDAFDPEKVTNYELGVKLDALDNRLRLNAALYHMNYDDMQITVTRQISDVTTAVAIANAGDATMQGVEMELSYVPTVNWFFQLGFNYINAEYGEFTDLVRDPDTGDLVELDRSDEDFAYLPKVTLSAVAQYSRDTSVGEFSGRLSGFYQDDIYIGLEGGADVSAFSSLPDYTLWNARFGFRPALDSDIDLALYIDNLTDENYFGTGNLQYAAQGTVTLVKGVRRTYGVQAVYRF